ncbi:hypothetical protein [Archangium lansingense]|uniref:Uncharacterized protein n=1 Tax=Archangium lansingense TaxID=2995310 RepID=A0ABT4A128_9BACT|nr:hypothetical protein [Archangium lansinium]MCY1075346.1 hypothetical protein [Archangium lansinium]
MSGSVAEIRRSLLARVRGLDALEIQVSGPFLVKIYARASSGQDDEELEERIRSVLHYVGQLAVRYEVSIAQDLPGAIEEEPPYARFRLASLNTTQVDWELKETLVRLVPSLGRLVFEKRPPDQPLALRVFVACEDGSTPELLIRDVRAALLAVGFAGLSVDVRPLPPDDSRNDLNNAGFFVPRREPRINNLLEQEEELFARRLKQVMSGAPPPLPLVDNFKGTKVLCTTSLGKATPISCFLPVYDRIYTVMSPGGGYPEGDYYLNRFGLKESDFLAYCRRGKIIPIFKFGLGVYPEAISRTFIEDPSLGFLGGRDLDYLAARYAWQGTPYLRMLREDRSLSHVLFELADSISETARAQDVNASLLRDASLVMIRGAEAFEGVMWRIGHLALPQFSPAMLLTHCLTRLSGENGRAAFAFIDMHSAAMHLCMAQAFGASLHTGLVVNESLLDFYADSFLPETKLMKKEQVSRMGEILKALEIAYSEKIPVDEYLDVFDQAETRRMRAIIADVLESKGEPVRDDEIRESVRAFNEGVRKLARNAIEIADVDVVGDLVKGGQIASGNAALIDVISKATSLKVLRRVSEMMFERVVEDTALADKLDKVRGAINGVPAQSVRLYRINNKIKRRT